MGVTKNYLENYNKILSRATYHGAPRYSGVRTMMSATNAYELYLKKTQLFNKHCRARSCI